MLLGRFTRRLDVQKKTALSVAIFVFLTVFFVLPLTAWAVTPDLGLNFATGIGLATTDIWTIIGNVIKAFLGLLGIIAVVLILYAGFLWMTAGGNEEKVTQAKQILVNATIGLIIIISSYAIAAFILGAITSEGGGGGGGGGGGPSAPNFFIGSGSGALGSGIIDYHYPEVGQTGVPRNTRIAITFKKPLVLSTVINGYSDGAGPTVGPPPAGQPQQYLNTDNIKIIALPLASATGTNADARFNARYATALASPELKASVTVITDPKLGTQTLVITPVNPIGSPTQDMNYRVALRGGALRANDSSTPLVDESKLGVQVWEPDPADATGAAYIKKPAFTHMDADGGYFWSFTTNTTIDVTPPRIVSVVPVARPVSDPCEGNSSCVYRNQLLQVYFDEAVDPTTASGILPGFNFIDVQAKCRSAALPCDFGRVCSDDANKACTGNSECGAGTCLATPAASFTAFSSVAGTMTIGNRYRTAEFLPSARCEGVAENSCGEPVYCLPKNVELKTVIKAAAVGDNPPMSSSNNGVVDMVGNSLDGNGNGTAEGPATPQAPEYSLNTHPAPAGFKDSASVNYLVGDAVDLVPPKIIAVDPPSTLVSSQTLLYRLVCQGGTNNGTPCTVDETCNGGGQCRPENPQTGGPSKVPIDLPIQVIWSKIMSVTSIRTGMPVDASATVTLDASECKKDLCTPAANPTNCTCDSLDPPSFFVESQLLPVASPPYTKMTFTHRPFFTANDLGYTEAEANLPTTPPKGAVPRYVPSLRAKLKDDKQNCFYPSEYAPTGGACTGIGVVFEPDSRTLKTSCCNNLAKGSPGCLP